MHDGKYAQRIFGQIQRRRQAPSQGNCDDNVAARLCPGRDQLPLRQTWVHRPTEAGSVSSVRDIEQRFTNDPRNLPRNSPIYKKSCRHPQGLGLRTSEAQMYDRLAFQTDSTRISTFLQAHDGSNRTFRHHWASAKATTGFPTTKNNEGKIKLIEKIDLFYIENFARFLQKMKSIQVGDGHRTDGVRHHLRRRHQRRQPAPPQQPCRSSKRRRQKPEEGERSQGVMPVNDNTPMANLYLTMLERGWRQGQGGWGLGRGRGRRCNCMEASRKPI